MELAQMNSEPETRNPDLETQNAEPGTRNPDLKILLIEDNPADADLLQKILTEAMSVSFELAQVSCLSAGLARLEAEPFQLILLDLALPDSSGMEAIARARAHAPDVPIIVLTGLDDEALALRAVREGAQDYLVKGRFQSELLVPSSASGRSGSCAPASRCAWPKRIITICTTTLPMATTRSMPMAWCRR
jgi:CheY-like chemotaxis protein